MEEEEEEEEEGERKRQRRRVSTKKGEEGEGIYALTATGTSRDFRSQQQVVSRAADGREKTKGGEHRWRV